MVRYRQAESQLHHFIVPRLRASVRLRARRRTPAYAPFLDARSSDDAERTAQGYRRFRCRECGKQFNECSAGLLNRTQYPSDVIALVVLWRLRYRLTLRDLAEMFLIRGIVFSYKAVREWEAKLIAILSDNLRQRRRRRRLAPRWYVDETYVKVKGRWGYLYRAIDRNGALVDVMLSERRNLAAATRAEHPRAGVVTPEIYDRGDQQRQAELGAEEDVRQPLSRGGGRRTDEYVATLRPSSGPAAAETKRSAATATACTVVTS